MLVSPALGLQDTNPSCPQAPCPFHVPAFWIWEKEKGETHQTLETPLQ